MWLFALAGAGLAAAEVFLGAAGMATWVPYAVLTPLALGGLAWLGRIQVAVVDDELRVDDARLPVRHIDSVTVLGAAAKRDLLGPHAQQYAFVIQRPWISGAVQVHLADPADPTPYWLVSSRRPADLAEAVRAARDLASQPAVQPGPAQPDLARVDPGQDHPAG